MRKGYRVVKTSGGGLYRGGKDKYKRGENTSEQKGRGGGGVVKG